MSDPADLTVNSAATLGAWQTMNFTSAEIASGLAAASADANGDGVSNLLEYAFGLAAFELREQQPPVDFELSKPAAVGKIQIVDHELGTGHTTILADRARSHE